MQPHVDTNTMSKSTSLDIQRCDRSSRTAILQYPDTEMWVLCPIHWPISSVSYVAVHTVSVLHNLARDSLELCIISHEVMQSVSSHRPILSVSLPIYSAQRTIQRVTASPSCSSTLYTKCLVCCCRLERPNRYERCIGVTRWCSAPQVVGTGGISLYFRGKHGEYMIENEKISTHMFLMRTWRECRENISYVLDHVDAISPRTTC